MTKNQGIKKIFNRIYRASQKYFDTHLFFPSPDEFFCCCCLAVCSMREESERHSFENVKMERSVDVEDDADDDQVEDLSMSRKSEKVSPPPSPVSVASVPNSDTAVPAAQTGVIVPPQK